MTPEQHRQVQRLLGRLAEATEEDRRAILEDTSLDPVVRREIQSLLEAGVEAAPFAETRPVLAQKGGATRPELGAPERIGTYRILSKIGEGGMGVVYKAKPEGSTTACALKVLKPGLKNEEIERRFRQEAEVLRRLRHPGIASFYDFGELPVETRGVLMGRRRYLAMELVEGESLLRYAARRDLDVSQRLELFARIADALDHAHKQGIVHRDLKPANILIVDPESSDDVGQPKVLDFGVARATVDELRLVTETYTGVLVGTIPYMSPEQVCSKTKDIDARSDVYSLGVLLFELLTERLPSDVKGRPVSEAARIIRSEEPRRLSVLDASLAGDLEHVLCHALEKEPEKRYPSAEAFATDIRTYLQGRPTVARAPGLIHRIRKWGKRHPVRTMSLGLGVIALVAITGLWARAVHARDIAHELASTARAATVLAEQRSDQLRVERGRVLRLADLKELEDLRAEARDLWPSLPQKVEAFESWILRAESLASRLTLHQESLEGLGQEETQEQLSTTWWRDNLRRLVSDLQTFVDEGELPSVRDRLSKALTIRERSLEAYEDLWDEAMIEIVDSDHYAGLELEPQIGLVPIGYDPETEFWEFWHVESGDRPQRDSATDQLQIEEASGIVLVLLPGGTFHMGAQKEDPSGPNYDPLVLNDAPLHEVTVSPFFMGKYEVTQAQWQRLMGANPSMYYPGNDFVADIDLTHPVEHVTWLEATSALRRIGLQLPTEAQWEYAARAGTSTPFWCGIEPRSLSICENVSDLSARDAGAPLDWKAEPWRDGYYCHAPVGSLLPNGFGLYDVLGNVLEWCRDTYRGNYYTMGPTVDPDCQDREGEEAYEHRVQRGGDFSFPSDRARVAYRGYTLALRTNTATGLRAMRSLDIESER